MATTSAIDGAVATRRKPGVAVATNGETVVQIGGRMSNRKIYKPDWTLMSGDIESSAVHLRGYII